MIRHSRDKGNEPNPKRIKELNRFFNYYILKQHNSSPIYLIIKNIIKCY